MAAFIPLFLSGARSGTVVGTKISVANTVVAEGIGNEAIDAYAAAKHQFAQGNYLASALEAGKALGGIAGYTGAATGTFLAVKPALTAFALYALGVTTLPLAATVTVGVASVLLASGAGSAVAEYIRTQSFEKALKSGVDGIVNPIPIAGVYLAGMNRSVEPPWPNYLGIPELLKSQQVHAGAASPNAPTHLPSASPRSAESSVKIYPALTTAAIQAHLSSDMDTAQSSKSKPDAIAVVGSNPVLVNSKPKPQPSTVI